VQRWWEEQQDGTVGISLLTRLAVLRLLTNKIAMNGMPVTPEEAVQAWQQLRYDPRSQHIEAEPIDHEPRFVALISGREPTPNLWTDAWLAALALCLDYEMTTFDRRFKVISRTQTTIANGTRGVAV
jgi:predicted nucleic acid-binding protein